MKIYNTLSRKKEDFIPINEGKVNMYVCGPTVYNNIHIGNARPIVFFDTVRRYLEYKNYDVNLVMNITDIDDKIINKAIEEGTDFKSISEKYTKILFENSKELNVELDKMILPKATDYLDDMIHFIHDLEAQDAAYDTSSTVYFNVDKAKDYGKLSKKDIESLDLGLRIDIDEEKKNPMDFALWKKKKLESEPSWDSPWGEGRPGWHIECSTMAKSILGETIDIHGGGEDLQFPHHENEIAQSETLHHKPFANYWMHNSMITMDKEKMSKSKGNFFTLEDIKKEYNLNVVRMWLISSHYRSPLDFSKENIEAIKNGYNRLKNTYELLERNIHDLNEESEKDENVNLYLEQFEKAMDDDFNSSNALSILFELSKYINTNYSNDYDNSKILYTKEIYQIMLDILGIRFEKEILDEEIENLIEERTQARKDRNFARADEIRDMLKEQGIELKDTPEGVIYSRN